jgi:hypothetical protein
MCREKPVVDIYEWSEAAIMYMYQQREERAKRYKKLDLRMDLTHTNTKTGFLGKLWNDQVNEGTVG